MSKKSRRRNRNLLKMAALAGGAALLAGRRGTAQGVSGADKAKFTSDAAYTAPVTGTTYPGANKAVVSDGPVLNKAGGIHAGKPAKGMLIKSRNQNRVTGVDAPPSILNPYRAPIQPKGRLWTSYSKGGRVKGGGKAKRGLGRAFTKAKK